MQKFITSLSTPDGIVLLLLGVAALLVVAIGILIFVHRVNSERIAQSESSLAELIQRTLAEQNRTYEALRQEFFSVSSDLKNTQSNHFVNFLGLIQSQGEAQSQRLERVQAGLFENLQRQSKIQDECLSRLTTSVTDNINAMRQTLTGELNSIRSTNDKALADMRQTVDEKLQTTLNARISESFKTVENQLMIVHKGLGEMREMAQNVDGLRRILTNVKTRGTFGEIQLGMILEQILTPEQYAVNVVTRPKSNERVEFAVRLPGPDDAAHVWLPIDAKFPMEDYERLLAASDTADAQLQATSLKAIEGRILAEAKKIHEKYVEVPYTTEFAVLYLPVEGLWAEVIKIPGLVERVQRQFHVTIAGPTVLSALLNSLQMGFRTLAIEKSSAQVWKLLGEFKMEFMRFNEVVDSLEKKIDTMKNAVGQVRTRTNVMNRRLKAVEATPTLALTSVSDDKTAAEHLE